MLVNMQIRLNRFVKNVSMQECDIKYLIDNPINCKTKDSAAMWNGWNNVNGVRGSVNTDYMSVLMLDIDGKTTYQDFLTQYNNKFKLFLYTTASHTEELHKFRVVIPLARNISSKGYDCIRKALIKYFPFADPMGFNHDQGFFIPTILPTTKEYLKYNNKCTILFDIEKELRNLITIEKMKQIDTTISNDRKQMYRKANYTLPDISHIITKEFYDILKGGDGSGRYEKFGSLILRNKERYSDLLLELFENSDYIHKKTMIKTISKP